MMQVILPLVLSIFLQYLLILVAALARNGELIPTLPIFAGIAQE
jgi:hypothetical protein